MVLWNGTFAKHYDGEHKTVMGHLKGDKGEAAYAVTDRVKIKANPISQDPLKVPRWAWKVVIVWGGREYIYLITSEKEDEPPTEKEIERQLEAYIKNPVEGGRNFEDYIITEE